MEGQLISVICPTLNEVRYIEKLLSFFIRSEPVGKEIYIVDGGSTDLTQEIVRNWSEKHSNIYLLINQKRYVPFALNLAIPKCKGSIIVRLDAHTEYAEDYFTQIINTFNSVDADIVGGPMRPKGQSMFQKAIAHSTTTKFGIGDSNFHFDSYKGYTDSVYLGAWKKEIFTQTGLFDNSLRRNQDDEFHYRAKSLGYKIFQNPTIKSWYHPRKDLGELFSQYFQYGLYKPLVLKKVNSEIKLRHLIPLIFVLYLIAITFLLFWGWIIFIPLMMYTMYALYFSYRNNLPWSAKVRCLLVYPTLHIAYGFGFLIGFFKLFDF